MKIGYLGERDSFALEMVEANEGGKSAGRVLNVAAG